MKVEHTFRTSESKCTLGLALPEHLGDVRIPQARSSPAPRRSLKGGTLRRAPFIRNAHLEWDGPGGLAHSVLYVGVLGSQEMFAGGAANSTAKQRSSTTRTQRCWHMHGLRPTTSEYTAGRP